MALDLVDGVEQGFIPTQRARFLSLLEDRVCPPFPVPALSLFYHFKGSGGEHHWVGALFPLCHLGLKSGWFAKIVYVGHVGC